MAADQRAALAGVEQDDGALSPDAVGEPVLQFVLANGTGGERDWVCAALIILRDKIEARVHRISVAGNEEHEGVPGMQDGGDAVDRLLDAGRGRLAVEKGRDLDVGVMPGAGFLQRGGKRCRVLHRQGQRTESRRPGGARGRPAAIGVRVDADGEDVQLSVSPDPPSLKIG